LAWALAIALIFGSITIFFVFMYSVLGRPRENEDEFGRTYISDDEHKIVRIGFLGMAAGSILYMLGTAFNIISLSGVTDEKILDLVDSISVIMTYIVYIFIAYLFMYLFYYLYNKVMSSSENLGRRLK
jgi:hypothetical protein